MSERKSINKYYPPDFDPSKIPKTKKKKNEVIKVRLQTPFSMRCTKCNEYISVARKFNARKEVTKEKYLNVNIIRFHIKCPICNNPITFKTHPQSGGFVPESGALRNFEPKNKSSSQVPVHETTDEILQRLLMEDKQDKQFQETKSKREKNPFYKSNGTDANDGSSITTDPEALQQKLQQQQRQFEIDEHLQYLQAKNARLAAKGSKSQVIDDIKRDLKDPQHDNQPEEDDEKLVKEAFKNFKSHQVKRPLVNNSNSQPLIMKKIKVDSTINTPKLQQEQQEQDRKSNPTTTTIVDYPSSDED